VAGAITVTLSLMLAVYGVVNGNEAGWGSTQTLGLLGAAVVLLAIFIAIESRVQHPLMPLGLFRLRSVSVANVVGVLWAAAMFAWFFIPSRWFVVLANLQTRVKASFGLSRMKLRNLPRRNGHLHNQFPAQRFIF
jgi:hypothetical protein